MNLPKPLVIGLNRSLPRMIYHRSIGLNKELAVFSRKLSGKSILERQMIHGDGYNWIVWPNQI